MNTVYLLHFEPLKLGGSLGNAPIMVIIAVRFLEESYQCGLRALLLLQRGPDQHQSTEEQKAVTQ